MLNWCYKDYAVLTQVELVRVPVWSTVCEKKAVDNRNVLKLTYYCKFFHYFNLIVYYSY